MTNSFILLGLVVAAGSQSDPTPQELMARIERRVDECRNIQFEYSVRCRLTPAPKGSNPAKASDVKSRNVLKLLDPARSDLIRPWHFWQKSVQNSDGTWVLDHFIAFDGAHTTSYAHTSESNPHWSAGSVLPFETPTAYAHNHFARTLLMGLSGVPKFDDPNWELARKSDMQWELAGSGKFKDQPTHILRARRGEVDLECEITGDPDYLIVRRLMRFVREPAGEPFWLIEVSSIGRLGAIVYPTAGRFRQRAIEHINGVDYEFTVSAVAPLTEAARESWVPPWPAGTAVRDQVSNEGFLVPHDKREAEKLRSIELQRHTLPSSGLSIGRKVLLVFNAVAVIGIAAFLARRRWLASSAP